MNPDDLVWHPTTFTKNRDRPFHEALMAKFLELLMASPEVKLLLCSEHFWVDGTLLRSLASHSLLSNQTHRSSNDGEARLFRKSNSTGAYLSDLGHCLMENRQGLVVASEVTPADGYGERAAVVRMARSLGGAHRKTLAADKGYDTRDFVADIRFAGITPHVARNIQARRSSAIDGRTVRHQDYGKSINARKRIEQVFGWIKQLLPGRTIGCHSRHSRHQVHGDVAGGGFRFRDGLMKVQLRQPFRGEVAIGSHAKPPVDGRAEEPHVIDRRPAALQGLSAVAGRRQGPQ